MKRQRIRPMNKSQEDELSALKVALMARLQGGVTVFQGVPFIHGVPATKKESSILESLSEWACPHCGSHLASQTFICLNLCHLTVPAYRAFQSRMAEAQAAVNRKQAMFEKLKQA